MGASWGWPAAFTCFTLRAEALRGREQGWWRVNRVASCEMPDDADLDFGGEGVVSGLL